MLCPVTGERRLEELGTRLEHAEQTVSFCVYISIQLASPPIDNHGEDNVHERLLFATLPVCATFIVKVIRVNVMYKCKNLSFFAKAKSNVQPSPGLAATTQLTSVL